MGDIIINSKLGNGFRFKAADSSKDQEHYFSNNKRHVSLALFGLSGSGELETNGIFSITTGDVVSLTGALHDSNKAFLPSSSYTETFLNESHDNREVRFNTILKLEVSRSDADFDIADFDVFFRETNSDDFIQVTEFFIESLDLNYKRLIMLQDLTASVALGNNATLFQVSSSAGSYTIRDVRLEINQPLDNGGVEEYKVIDNDNNEKVLNSINRRIFFNVEV